MTIAKKNTSNANLKATKVSIAIEKEKSSAASEYQTGQLRRSSRVQVLEEEKLAEIAKKKRTESRLRKQLEQAKKETELTEEKLALHDKPTDLPIEKKQYWRKFVTAARILTFTNSFVVELLLDMRMIKVVSIVGYLKKTSAMNAVWEPCETIGSSSFSVISVMESITSHV